VSNAVEPSTPPVWSQGGIAPRVRPRVVSIERLFERLTVVALVLCLASDVFGGVVRYALSTLGLTFLIYVPMVFGAVLAGAYFMYQGATSRLDRRVFAILGFFVVYAFYSLVVRAGDGIAEFGRVAMGLYTWTPFFLGLMLASQGAEMWLVHYAALWWAPAVIGVIVNRFVYFPWTGSTIEVLGQESQVARDWATNGLDRLAGFSRASYTVANQITVFGLLLVTRPSGRRIVQALVWILSATAVALTTTKTALAMLLLVPLTWWVPQLLLVRYSRRHEARFYVPMVTLAALMAMVVLLPGSSEIQQVLLKYYSVGDVGFFSFSSMLDRTAVMWPAAFALITDDHTAVEWLLGRGLGGIGAAQAMFEPHYANSADNLFVFLYVTFGLNCAVFGLAIFTRFHAVYREMSDRFVMFFALAATVLTLGMTTNVIESTVPAIALGILAGKFSRGVPPSESAQRMAH
jgi:hypothetical protein